MGSSSMPIPRPSLGALKEIGPRVGRPIQETFADSPEVVHDYERALRGETFSTRLNLGGSVYQARYAPTLNDQGEVQGVIGTALDISQQVWAEDTLYRNRERIRSILRQSPVGGYWINLDDQKLTSSSGLLEMLGYPMDQEINIDPLDHLFADDLASVKEIRDSLSSGKLNRAEIEYRLLSKSGEIVWVRDTISRIDGVAGDAPIAVAVVADITRQKQAAEDLRKQTFQIRSILECIPIGIWITDAQGKFIEDNPANQAIWGEPPSLEPEFFAKFRCLFSDTGKTRRTG